MAATILQSPSDVCFAGNPILIKAHTNLTDKTFQKVCVEVEATLLREDSVLHNQTFHLSIPTQGGTEAVWFDISSCMRSMLNQVEPDSMFTKASPNNPNTLGQVRYRFKVWDEYLDDNNEIISSKGAATSNGKNLFAIPGSMNDMQRIQAGEDTASALGKTRLMSNKPVGEVIPMGGQWICGVFSTVNRLTKLMVNDSWNKVECQLHAYETSIAYTTFNQKGAYSITLDKELPTDTPLRKVPVHVIDSSLLHCTYFEFINRLGALESVYCYGLRKESSSTDIETNALYQGMTYAPSSRIGKRVKKDERSIELSTGPVSRDWARWFAEELFQSECVYMLDSSTDRMIPVLIEADGDLNLMNEAEAEVIDLPFKVTIAYEGYSVGDFLS